MKILVTGAKGFVGRNLCLELKNIRDGKSRCWGLGPAVRTDAHHSHLYETIDEVFEYDIDSTAEELERYCKEADFVFNLAGVNRPKDASEFMQGNFGFASTLLDTLKKYGNKCPVMLSSSQQASLTGRFAHPSHCLTAAGPSRSRSHGRLRVPRLLPPNLANVARKQPALRTKVATATVR